jgi:hypothetical protein
VLIGDLFKEDIDALWPLLDDLKADQSAAS